MDKKARLVFYLEEAKKHQEKIEKAKKVLQSRSPFDEATMEGLTEIEKDKLDVLAFRFAKLQDLMGEKIFRLYLELNAVSTKRPFVELLSMLEKEGMLDVDEWIALREARNALAHEYPYHVQALVESINYLLSHTDLLFDILDRIERRLDALA